MFIVFISRLLRFYWLIFKTQCSVSIDKKYTNRFYSFRSARLVPECHTGIIPGTWHNAHDICSLITRFGFTSSGQEIMSIECDALHYSLSTRSNHQQRALFLSFALHEPEPGATASVHLLLTLSMIWSYHLIDTCAEEII